jgi:acyl-CoA thioesterase II
VRDFQRDTAVSGGDGHYSATLAEGWDIWGPQGGYVAAVALRAAGAAGSFPRPASLACHYLRPAQPGSVEIEVESLRRARRAESLRVTLTQEDAPIFAAVVWVVAELVGVDHHAVAAPVAPPPEELRPWDELLPEGEPRFPFWRNLDVRPVAPNPFGWGQAAAPRFLVWQRLRARPLLEDPVVDAGRMMVSADSTMYPAAMLGQPRPFPYVAPSMDLVMSFHAAGAGSEWLLLDAVSPLAEGGLVAGRALIWSEDGRLLASAMQQMLQRT